MIKQLKYKDMFQPIMQQVNPRTNRARRHKCCVLQPRSASQYASPQCLQPLVQMIVSFRHRSKML